LDSWADRTATLLFFIIMGTDYSLPCRFWLVFFHPLIYTFLMCMLYLSDFSTSLLWQPIAVFGTELHGTSPTTVCQSPKFLVTNICDLPDVINCQFREFAAAPSGSVHFLSPDQQSGIHCLIICRIQLLTPNNLGGTWRRICSPDIRSVSALKVLRNRALQIDIYLLTYLLTYLYDSLWKLVSRRTRTQTGHQELQNENSALKMQNPIRLATIFKKMHNFSGTCDPYV